MRLHKKLLVVVVCSLCACTGKYDATRYSSSNKQLIYPHTVAYYQARANESVDIESEQAYQLKVIGRLIQDGALLTASQKLKALKGLSDSLRDEKYLLEAKLSVLKKQSSRALQFISKVSQPSELSPSMKRFYHQILAHAYRLQGKKLNEVAQLIALDNLEQDSQSKLATRRAIWRSLSSIPLEQEKALVIEANGELEGWLSLNIISRDNQGEGAKLLTAISKWRTEHPSHPGNDIVININQQLQKPVKEIALLLPLSGPLKGPGQAVRDGFMSSYFAAKSKGASVKIYDTNQGDIKSVYQKALANGADMIIGPLKKDNVRELANQRVSVPTIALNDIEQSMPSNFYQFSIDPHIEAIQLANRVYGDGYRRALIIAPEGSWGESIAQSFLQNWHHLGGAVAASMYFSNQTNIKQAIGQVLGISDSDNRKNNLVRTIWKQPKFYPRRRQDFDVVILLAYASKARQIRPMLKYYFAGDVPIYATSLIYSGAPNPQADADLNGITFGDMPYLLKQPDKLVHKSWPEQFNSYNRLLALGKDAYLLSGQLNQLKIFPMMGVLDNTGTLFIDGNGQIVRQLDWAIFNSGLARPLS